jgi:hypothetical protein
MKSLFKAYLGGRGMSLLLLFAPLCANGQRLEYISANAESVRPLPPRNLRAVEINNEPVKVVLSYQTILDGLSSADQPVREAAALELYKQKARHDYDIDLLSPFLKDTDGRVIQFLTSTLLDIVVTKPYKQRNLSTYADRIRSILAKSEDRYTRANCIGLLGSISQNFADIEKLIVQAIRNGEYYELRNAVTAVNNFSPKSVEALNAIASRLSDPNARTLVELLANAMVRVAQAFESSNETFYADRIDEAQTALSHWPGMDQQTRFLTDAAKRIRQTYANGSRSLATTSESHVTYVVHESLNPELFLQPGATLNGINSNYFKPGAAPRSLEFLGSSPPIREGLNWVETLKVKYLLWAEDGVLRKFDNPYQNSRAILVAIDTYGGSSKTNSPEGYKYLGNMVNNAKRLSIQLEKNGFAKTNILWLTNEMATSTAIENLLEEFWKGGRYADTDRLIFYFGGHGDSVENAAAEGDDPPRTGFLVTADHDRNKPTKTSLLMEDLTSRHFKNIVSKQFLVLLDSCSSGLALPRLEDSSGDTNALKKFKKFVIIDAESRRPARNILVAGTGLQKALWENGGVFTTSLIDGLRGSADYNGDGIIEFDEISLFVKQSVRARAAITGVEQEPVGFKLSTYAKGSFLFLGQ